jgi:AAA ATPase-like protein
VVKNVPVHLTSFVGRERELAELAQLLDDVRLLTLVGAGGVGKTRLALRLATDMVSSMADGVWVVELAALQDPELVPHAVAATLSVRERPDQPVRVTLGEALHTQELLLVLDNCPWTPDRGLRRAGAGAAAGVPEAARRGDQPPTARPGGGDDVAGEFPGDARPPARLGR